MSRVEKARGVIAVGVLGLFATGPFGAPLWIQYEAIGLLVSIAVFEIAGGDA